MADKQESFDPVTHYELDDAQVESLIGAIESSPITSNGESSEAVIKAALYLTGDNPTEREQEFIDALVEIKDINVIQQEEATFEQILEDFSSSTTDEPAPQVMQTKYRLDRIVSLFDQAAQILANAEKRRKKVQKGTRKLQPLENSKGDGTDKPIEKSSSIFDSNWFRFAAFSIVAVLLLLAIVFIVQWLRKTNETDEKAKLAKEKEKEKEEELKTVGNTDMI